MGFYDLDKTQREKLKHKIQQNLLQDLQSNKRGNLKKYFSNEDTYIRKTAYQAIGAFFKTVPELQDNIMDALDELIGEENFHIRQTAVNAAGEIGIKNFALIEKFLEKGLFDSHHAVRNAVIGSLKKTGKKNPAPSLKWAKKFLKHPDKEIRREICHGIELRGRTHPEDILPLLRELEFDETSRVRKTIVHVLGQISYKKGCLEKVLDHLKSWENDKLVNEALKEIVVIHERYKDFAFLTSKEVRVKIKKWPTF